MPRSSEEANVAFRELLPADETVKVRPMFGNLAAFVNGNMCTGLFGDDLFVRLPAGDAERVVAEGGAPFAPMPGRAMAGYVVVRGPWLANRDEAGAWVERSLAWTRGLPAKTPKAKRA
jgi:TfoX/Sxy family transcriptional regulator of competence genes